MLNFVQIPPSLFKSMNSSNSLPYPNVPDATVTGFFIFIPARFTLVFIYFLLFQSYANENNIPCEISLEQKMACGIGACLGCAVKTAKSPSDAPQYWHVCKAGPVFNAQDVEI